MPARRKKPVTIEDQLRKAIKASGLTTYALAKASGVTHQQIGRFLSEEREPGLKTAAKLATALGLQLAPVAAGETALEQAANITADDPGAVVAAVQQTQTRLAPARLADVFKSLQATNQTWTLGRFHDAARQLAADGKVKLSPWTQAGYQLRDGEACLILGSEVMAYAEAR